MVRLNDSVDQDGAGTLTDEGLSISVFRVSDGPRDSECDAAVATGIDRAEERITSPHTVPSGDLLATHANSLITLLTLWRKRAA
ncbi:hypothetical protein ACTWPB_15910 [Nocardia sp. IBHARD005]|uniref:hypothetical protein n=1 Tax=Nocardia sp. IBHARD005 TaxID=3457765 RepID=UPI0040599F2D